MSDEYQTPDISRYSRRRFKNKNGDKNCAHVESRPMNCTHDEHIESSSSSCYEEPSCICEIDLDLDLAHIPHKKCPSIVLTQQQLQRLLNERDCLLTTATPSSR
ncbi:hypothetical protein EVAR_27742_1 [Eumeta japonica]|uniref:Uncharacterized protein n=1 Tax=Eumeta variegata TaxID=151549 RepID=A0A4C1VC02_EUMVA|nr:hypothetical protein EVAR_27742_1 [Eumeta japonica]